MRPFVSTTGHHGILPTATVGQAMRGSSGRTIGRTRWRPPCPANGQLSAAYTIWMTYKNADMASLNNGGWDGRILAVYTHTKCFEDCHRITLWITRNTAMEDGTQAVMVMFPEDY